MKKLLMVLPLIFLLCFMVGCQDKAAMAELEALKAQAALEEQNKAKVIHFIEEMDKKNFDVYDELMADKFVMHFPPFPDEDSLETCKQSAHATYVEIPDYNHTIEDILAKGDIVVARLTNRGTVKESGIKFEFPAIVVFQFVDGKVVETWAMPDNLGFNQQLGMELKPKEGEKRNPPD
jgi:ketosteroid isomerase-like protein